MQLQTFDSEGREDNKMFISARTTQGQAQRPPKSGGQHDRDEVEIVRGEVPKPPPYKVCLGTSPRAPLSGRAALLTQEGVARLQITLYVREVCERSPKVWSHAR